MTTLAEALLRTAYALKSLRNSIATGGSINHLIDTTLNEPDQFFNGGTIFFLSGTTMTGKTAVINDWDEATHTFTYFPDPGGTMGSGIRYAVAESRYSRETMVQAINQALSELGPLQQRDETLITVINQAEYDLPADVSDVKRVQIAENLTEPYNWQTHHWWMEWEGILVLDEYHLPDTAGLKIRIWYEAAHPAVYLDADEIAETIHIDRLAWTAAWFAAMSRSGLAENSEPVSKELATLANQMRIMQSRHPIRRIAKDPLWASWA